MLGRAMDQDVAVLHGHREGDLAFEIEMILAADIEAALQALGRARRGRGGIAPAHDMIGHQEAARRQRLLDAEQRPAAPHIRRPRAWRRRGRLAKLSAATAKSDLAMEDDLACRQKSGSSPAPTGLTSFLPGISADGEHRDDARRGANRREIELGDPRMGAGGGAGDEMQQVPRGSGCRRHRGPRR